MSWVLRYRNPLRTLVVFCVLRVNAAIFKAKRFDDYKQILEDKKSFIEECPLARNTSSKQCEHTQYRKLIFRPLIDKPCSPDLNSVLIQAASLATQDAVKRVQEAKSIKESFDRRLAPSLGVGYMHLHVNTYTYLSLFRFQTGDFPFQRNQIWSFAFANTQCLFKCAFQVMVKSSPGVGPSTPLGSINTYIHTYIHTYTYIRIQTYTYVYKHIHTYTNTYIRIQTHTYVYKHIHTYTNAYIRIQTHIYVYKHIDTYIHSYIHTYIHTYTDTYIHTYRHTYTHTHTHTHIHTYIHTCKYTHTHAYIYIHRRPRIFQYL